MSVQLQDQYSLQVHVTIISADQGTHKKSFEALNLNLRFNISKLGFSKSGFHRKCNARRQQEISTFRSVRCRFKTQVNYKQWCRIGINDIDLFWGSFQSTILLPHSMSCLSDFQVINFFEISPFLRSLSCEFGEKILALINALSFPMSETILLVNIF